MVHVSFLRNVHESHGHGFFTKVECSLCLNSRLFDLKTAVRSGVNRQPHVWISHSRQDGTWTEGEATGGTKHTSRVSSARVGACDSEARG